MPFPYRKDEITYEETAAGAAAKLEAQRLARKPASSKKELDMNDPKQSVEFLKYDLPMHLSTLPLKRAQEMVLELKTMYQRQFDRKGKDMGWPQGDELTREKELKRGIENFKKVSSELFDIWRNMEQDDEGRAQFVKIYNSYYPDVPKVKYIRGGKSGIKDTMVKDGLGDMLAERNKKIWEEFREEVDPGGAIMRGIKRNPANPTRSK